MLCLKPLVNVVDFFCELQKELRSVQDVNCTRLSDKALNWLSMCVSTIIITGSLCWDKMERSSAGKIRAKALSWMFHRGKRIPWSKLLISSVKVLIKSFDIKVVQLVCDDTDRKRSKNTKKIFGVHLTKDKESTGYIKAQNIVFLALVCSKVTFFVGFKFYRPDPNIKKWAKKDKELRKKGIKKRNRPSRPLESKDYPIKNTIFLNLLKEFKASFPDIVVKSITADAAYMSAKTSKKIAVIYEKAQFLSQLRQNQVVGIGKHTTMSVAKYFSYLKPQERKILLRGSEKTVWLAREKLFVKSIGKEMLVVAIKYDLENKFRFIIASDPTWLCSSIIKSYALRWLIEVAIEDWKQNDGWGIGASQQGIDGACRGVNLSLLVDHIFLHHPMQRNLLQAGKPLVTVGTLRTHIQLEALIKAFETVVESADPRATLDQLKKGLTEVAIFRPSRKHMVAMDCKVEFAV